MRTGRQERGSAGASGVPGSAGWGGVGQLAALLHLDLLFKERICLVRIPVPVTSISFFAK